MTMLITSDGSLLQEQIVRVAYNLGFSRLLSTTLVGSFDTVFFQLGDMQTNLRKVSQLPDSVTKIAWLQDFPSVRKYSKQSIKFLKECAGIIVPTVQIKKWLVQHGIASKKITDCLLVSTIGSKARPTYNIKRHTHLPKGLPYQIAIAKLNQEGGWGDINMANPLTVLKIINDFISAGLPILARRGSSTATIINKYHIGLCYDDATDRDVKIKKVTTTKYQQLVTNVMRVSSLASQGYFIRKAIINAAYQAQISSIDKTSQHPKFGIHVMNNQDTLDYIERYHPSVARFGDGEISLMLGANQVFQKTDKLLERRLREIVDQPSSPHLLICLSDTFHDLGRYVPRAQKWWKGHQQTFASFYKELGKKGNIYGNTMVTRAYMDLQDRTQAGKVFQRIKEWWQDRDLLIVEGLYTRSGVGNDLYLNAHSVQRIICPPKNAWSKYRQIEKAIKRYGQGKLVLVMLGMTATVIAADLSDWGQVIDSGHLDTEYEWYCQGATNRIPIRGKHTAEMNYDQGLPRSIDDPKYQSEIILDLSK